jgi:hypothetical protein
MSWCSDPYLNLLKSFGYQPVWLPKASVAPLQILAREGSDLSWLGAIETILVPGAAAPVPTVKKDQKAANISGRSTGAFNLGVGLTILGRCIGAMGGSKLGLDVQYKQAKSMVFEFSEVWEDSIEVLKLDQYLKGADINPLSDYAVRLLEADELHATTATIKARQFSAEAMRSDDAAL